jgi:hypothetical protein
MNKTSTNNNINTLIFLIAAQCNIQLTPHCIYTLHTLCFHHYIQHYDTNHKTPPAPQKSADYLNTAKM